ncbi:chemotaxis protein CheB [Limnohabitans sp.]|uniref:chemotaxis protein CheB n=1 Tax=Limnohabitans sp. TaxID=1907725 RepID=UPI0039BC6BFF|nr:PAS domain-containing protein [Comamonadaceae bacterium]
MSDSPSGSSPVLGTRVVGIGASAGGLEALERFFNHLPATTDWAYVVVQHTRSGHKTLLGDLLQRVTEIPIEEACNGAVILPNRIYFMPIGGTLKIARGCLHFQAAKRLKNTQAPIDIFLSSLAADQAHRAVGVVLSGMGHDGTEGLKAIHHAGGLCLAQQPDTAAFDSMPQSAIDASCVHRVALPEDMPAYIARWALEHTAQTHTPESISSTEGLQAIVDLLHQKLQHDFSLYKPSTLLRRIERRMHVHQLSAMGDYLQCLQQNPRELDLLFSEMLIGVTCFFRDEPVWLDLSAHVLPHLVIKPPKEAIRAWVLGCSTGEEAYSLAMLMQESLDPADPNTAPVQIYATDLNPAAIAVARKGWYSAQALAHVSEARQKGFFTRHEGGFSIHPTLRAMVIFAQHDVIIDPPFTKLDLLLCRNVLIYFNATLQKRLIRLFHFSLRAGGTLVLGSAETVGRTQHLFNTLISKSRIYGRVCLTPKPESVVFPVHRRADARPLNSELPVTPSIAHPSQNLQTMADHVLLQTFSPAAVLVNADGDILYISGKTGQYLEPAAGKANWNIHVMLRPELRAQIALGLRQALQDQKSVVLNDLSFEKEGLRPLQVTVYPLQEPSALVGMVMVIFKDLPDPSSLSSGSTGVPATANPDIQSTWDEMQPLRQEVLPSQAQMHALNKSLKQNIEELQAANEELTTAKEEGQSMNEELQTINSELQTRLDDLALAQSDMQNLLNSTDIATLFLDNDLNVRRYTEQAVAIFHLRDADVGRPLSDLANTLYYPLLLDDVKETLRTLAPCTKSIVASDGRWFSVRIMPYRTLANMVNGAVLTFVDISTAKALEFRLREAN